jgi:hypothetical protein
MLGAAGGPPELSSELALNRSVRPIRLPTLPLALESKKPDSFRCRANTHVTIENYFFEVAISRAWTRWA